MLTTFVVVRCPDCGETREISIRQRRRIRNGDSTDLCPLCRTLPKAAQASAADKEFWLEGHSLEWIRETAAMIWGDDE